MKRMLSLILVSVMLLATVFMCKVDVKAAEVEKMPFYLSNDCKCINLTCFSFRNIGTKLHNLFPLLLFVFSTFILFHKLPP